MHRRELLRAGLAGALLPLLPGVAGAAAPDDWAAAFAAALPEKPWLLGYRSVAEERLETSRLPVEGRLPPGLSGRLTRNGPARHEVGGVRYRHWFDGDGMLQQFRFADGTVSHRGRFVATEKHRAEVAAGRMLVPGFGTVLPGMGGVRGPDAMNVANISALEHGGRLLALWEGGSAHDVDPETLETRGPVVWSDQAAGLPFSAHPRVEPDGTLWNIGTAAYAGVLVIYRIGADGRLAELVPHRVPDLGMVHDFITTERHLVIPLPPLALDRDRARAGASFLDSHVWQPQRPTRLMLVAKDDLTRARFAELPAGWIFHYGNGWEDGDGVIRFDACWYGEPGDTLQGMSEVMRGGEPGGARSRPAHIRLDSRSLRAEVRFGEGAVEFPRIDPRKAARRNRHLWTLTRGRDARDLNTVRRFDLESGAEEIFDYGPTVLAEEHLFVPRPGSDGEGQGWLLGTSLDWKEGVTRLAVFDALDLASGPLALARLPYALPLGLHGNFHAG
ncbi:MAG TPA: carotenoid oxygenase family protein [Azospirillaceae bacterium]|nr:carotenoid oxygenase family protein [Azospirillaceae bacterium]